MVDSGVVVSVFGSGGGVDVGGFIFGEGGVDGSWGRFFGCFRFRSVVGRRGGRRGRGRGFSGEDKVISDGVGSGISFGVYIFGVVESFVFFIVGVVVVSFVRVVVVIRVVDLVGGRVEVVDGFVGGSVLGEVGIVSIFVSGGIGVVIFSFFGLVFVVVVMSEVLVG